ASFLYPGIRTGSIAAYPGRKPAVSWLDPRKSGVDVARRHHFKRPQRIRTHRQYRYGECGRLSDKRNKHLRDPVSPRSDPFAGGKKAAGEFPGGYLRLRPELD